MNKEKWFIKSNQISSCEIIQLDKINMIEQARQILKDNGYLVDNLWHTDDIMVIASDLGIDLTTEGVEIIRDMIHKSHDATIGINNEVIQCAIESFKSKDND